MIVIKTLVTLGMKIEISSKESKWQILMKLLKF